MNCTQAKKISLISILNKLGAVEKKRRGNDIWYISLFRKEKEASFKVDISKNIWFDFGLGQGGNVLDFVMIYYQCNLKEALSILRENSFSFHKQNLSISQPKKSEFKIQKKQNLQNRILINYLESRNITYEIARIYCFEVYYWILRFDLCQ